jgi:hypothetical protein
LATFAVELRASLNHLFVDTLRRGPTSPRDRLVSLQVDIETGEGGFEPLRPLQPPVERQVRDLKIVPVRPPQIAARTGDRLRITAQAATAGYLAIFNVGPTGNLNFLLGQTRFAAVAEDRPIVVSPISVADPPGIERIVAVWSPIPVHDFLPSLLSEGQLPTSRGYRATRDLIALAEQVAAARSEPLVVQTLELNHLP